MTTTNDYILLGISATLHLLVDGVCMCCLFLMATLVGSDELMGSVIVYNVLAFLTQPLTGLLADSSKHRQKLLLTSNLLLVAGAATAVFAVLHMQLSTPLLTTIAVLLGMGNSLFHVWGGKQTAVKTRNDIRALGIFVSTGALGLALGMLFCSWSLLFVFLLAISVLSGVYIKMEQRAGSISTNDERLAEHATNATRATLTLSLPVVCLALLGLMVFVAFRSFLGEAFSTGITRTNNIVLLIAFITTAGKMAGGWIARWMGIVPSLLAIAAIVAAAFLTAQWLGMSVLLAGLFAINLTMPITLYLANRVLEGREGLAFGLLAAALIPGYLLATI